MQLMVLFSIGFCQSSENSVLLSQRIHGTKVKEAARTRELEWANHGVTEKEHKEKKQERERERARGGKEKERERETERERERERKGTAKKTKRRTEQRED